MFVFEIHRFIKANALRERLFNIHGSSATSNEVGRKKSELHQGFCVCYTV